MEETTGKCTVIEGFSMSIGTDGVWLYSPILDGESYAVNLNEFNHPGKRMAPMIQAFLRDCRTKKDHENGRENY